MTRPELLAPVNGPEGLHAALAAGADAVYLGLRDFNARRKAQNFTLTELESAVHTCRRAGCKVYLTFNTLLIDEERTRALKVLGAAYEAGIDAAIVQDIGLALAMRRWLPDLPLHASTQMTVHHPSQLGPLADLGIVRVIVARELSLEEVRIMVEAGRAWKIGVEVFIHGALCVSYSGQCLISAFMEGRSGNRGLCAQLCRRPFQAGTSRRWGKKRLVLSMKDLSALPLLPELVEAGVDGLKVEGRLKRPEYVAGVVQIYREALEKIARGRPGPFPDLEDRLSLVYNRGFSLGGLGKEFAAASTTGKWGGARFLKVGEVSRIDRGRNRLFVKIARMPEPGDGVAFFPSDGGPLQAFVVTKIFPQEPSGSWIGVKPLDGDLQACSENGLLALSSSAALLDRIRALIAAYKPPPIEIELDVSGRLGEPLKATARTHQGWTAEASTSQPLQAASKQPLDGKILEEQLGRLGNTPFVLKHLNWQGGSDLFIPVKALNALRRSLATDLDQQRTRRRTLPGRFKVSDKHTASDERATSDEHAPKTTERKIVTDIAVLCSAEEAGAAFEAGAKRVYLPAEDLIVNSELAVPGGFILWIWAPPVTTFPYFDRLAEWLENHRQAVEGVLAGHVGIAKKAMELDLPFWADTSFNLTNILACEQIRAMGAAGAALSWELDSKCIGGIAEAAVLPLEVAAFGRPPMMQTALTGFASEKNRSYLKDESDRIFPVRPWPLGSGFTVEAPYYRAMAGGLAALKGRIDLVRLDLRDLPGARFSAIINAFRSMLTGGIDNKEFEAALQEIVAPGDRVELRIE